MQQIEAVTELVDIGVKLQAELVGGCAADAEMEHGATLPLQTELVEHDPIEAWPQIVPLADYLPYSPLRLVAVEREVADHRGMQLGVRPGLCWPLPRRLR